MKSDRVVVFILDLNHSNETMQAINSVRSCNSKNIEIMVHINGSDRDHAARLTQSLSGRSGVRVSRTERNLGYAGGNNYLLQKLQKEEKISGYILLLNNDAQLQKQAVARLQSVLDIYPDVGAVGPRILHHTPKDLIATDGAYVWPWFMQQSFRNSGKRIQDCPAPAPFAVPFIPGTCMMIRADLFIKLGGLDERFFAYFEDWDLCLRMHELGYRCLHVAEAEVRHVGSMTSGTDSLKYYFLMTRNRYLMARKHLPLHIFVFLFLPYFVVSRIAYKVIFLLVRNKLQGIKGILLALAWIMAPANRKPVFWPITNT